MYLISGKPIIDVRAPLEFEAGALPGSVNLPILNDEERKAVGTLYKKEGQKAAIELGHRLVSGSVREERVRSWVRFLKKNSGSVLTCWRGGLRSKIATQWLKDIGVEVVRLKGGYKAARRECLRAIERFSEIKNLKVISGATGSGKTELLKALSGRQSVIDLEEYANHRGSAFGERENPQPSQATFENRLAVEILRAIVHPAGSFTLIEDESRMIGKRVVPGRVFEALRNAPVVLIEETPEFRVEQTFQEYVQKSGLASPRSVEAKETMDHYFRCLERITKKLGPNRTKEARLLMSAAWKGGELDRHRDWIEYLLVHYYDPLYAKGLETRRPRIEFRGSYTSCLAYLAG